MTFNSSLFNAVLSFIEENLSFIGDDITNPQDWNMKLDLKVQDIFEHCSGEENEIRYIIKVLDSMNYISFNPNDISLIDGVTQKGFQLGV